MIRVFVIGTALLYGQALIGCIAPLERAMAQSAAATCQFDSLYGHKDKANRHLNVVAVDLSHGGCRQK